MTEPRRFRRLFRLPLFRARPEEVDEEIRFHLEERTRYFVRRGYSEDAARAEARERFGIHGDGDLTRIRTELQRSAERREERMRFGDRLDMLGRDVRYALRGMRTRPGFAIAVVLTLALGIGATTAIYSVVQAVLLRPLPYSDADRVVMVWNHWTNWPRTWLSEPEAYDYAAQTEIFERFAPFTTGALNLTSSEGDPERVSVGVVSAPLFDVTGVRPLAGRTFTAAEDVANGPRVAMLSEQLWRRRFAEDRSIIGKDITLNGDSYQVVGIVGDDFRLPVQFAGDYAQAYVPLQLGPSSEDNRGSHYLHAVARLRAGVSVPQGQRRANDFIERLKQDHKDAYGPEFGMTLVPITEQVRGDITPVLLVLLGAVSFVLLIGCVNVANLLLSRAESRHREIAVRTALGASQSRLAVQLLTESVVLSLIGGALGLALAVWLARALASANLATLPRADGIHVNGSVLAFAAVVSVLTGLLFGLAPMIHALRGSGSGMLKQGRGNTASRSSFRMRGVLIAAEITLAVVATTGAVLMGRSFARLLSVSPGFSADRALTFRVSAPPARYRESSRVRDFYDRLLQRVAAVPGVRAAGGITSLPLTSDLGDWSVAIEGVPPTPFGTPGPAIDWQAATAGYIEAMNIGVVRGRSIASADRLDAEHVVVINETAARKYWPTQDALGQRIKLGGTADSVWRRIVGITRDVRHSGLDKDVRPQMYIPYAQFLATVPDTAGAVPRSLTIVARTQNDPAAATSAMRAAVKELDPSLPLAQVRTLDEVFDRSVSTPRVVTLLMGAFGGLALLLSAIGVYGVTAYAVARRTNEIGIRVALGARVRDVVRLIVLQGMRPAVAGLLLGAVLAFWGTRLMARFLYGVSPNDPVSLVAAPLALLLVGLAANWLPARRAARVDPVSALREE
jgi:putative ABC transport system permease protein